ncbi:MAG: hypothetical protein OIN66_02100 [Candidatus Methanoperedens sp.]|nr:hypothetical protein [Candidatus Methanoperedens sp.]
MEPNIYSDPANNIRCSYRFTCGAKACPGISASPGMPSCHVDKFRRYQPESEFWCRRSWEEVNRITWREVFCLQESWIYTLLVIIITVFMFMAMILIKLLLKI